jgi:hypothetical protein
LNELFDSLECFLLRRHLKLGAGIRQYSQKAGTSTGKMAADHMTSL